jgi:hypothetical protein
MLLRMHRGVDLLVDNQKVNQQPLTFPQNTGYLSVNAGTRNVKVNVAGTNHNRYQCQFAA